MKVRALRRVASRGKVAILGEQQRILEVVLDTYQNEMFFGSLGKCCICIKGDGSVLHN
jgi:hypothetical protein